MRRIDFKNLFFKYKDRNCYFKYYSLNPLLFQLPNTAVINIYVNIHDPIERLVFNEWTTITITNINKQLEGAYNNV